MKEIEMSKIGFLQNSIMFTVTQHTPSKIIDKQRDGDTMRQLIQHKNYV